jgi:hypothetical protein
MHMSQPVKLSDELVLAARIDGETQQRSIAGQVEFWAKLGRSVELLLDGSRVVALIKSGRVEPLSKALALVDTPAGRKRVEDYLASQPFPHFRQRPDQPGMLIRTDQDGNETVGRFVNRAFVAAKVESETPALSSVVRKANKKQRILRGKPAKRRLGAAPAPRTQARKQEVCA